MCSMHFYTFKHQKILRLSSEFFFGGGITLQLRGLQAHRNVGSSNQSLFEAHRTAARSPSFDCKGFFSPPRWKSLRHVLKKMTLRCTFEAAIPNAEFLFFTALQQGVTIVFKRMTTQKNTSNCVVPANCPHHMAGKGWRFIMYHHISHIFTHRIIQ